MSQVRCCSICGAGWTWLREAQLAATAVEWAEVAGAPGFFPFPGESHSPTPLRHALQPGKRSQLATEEDGVP
jgi:hypothetical protein